MGNNNDFVHFSIGQIIDAIYKYLWDRETKRLREPKQKSDEWWERTARLAYITSCHTSFRLKTIDRNLKSKKLKYRVLNLGIITKRSKILYSFFTDLTQAYYIANYFMNETIYTNNPFEQLNQSLFRCQGEFKELVCTIISDISNTQFHQSNSNGGCNDSQ